MKLNLRYTKPQIVLGLCLLSSLFGYFLCDRRQTFNNNEFYLAFFDVIVAVVVYFKAKKKINYFDFDSIFIMTCFMIGFLATFFINEIFFVRLFFYDFNQKYVNSGSWLYSIGMISYFLGSLSRSKKHFISASRAYSGIYPTKGLFYILLLMMILFSLTGGFTYYKSSYHGESSDVGLTFHFTILITIVSLVLMSMEYINKVNHRDYKLHRYYFVTITMFSIFIMISGNRGSASQLMLPMVGLYTFFFKPINLKYCVIGFFPLFILMFIIQNTREGSDVSFQLESPVLMARDMTIPYRQTFVSMEYVDKYGYSYGKTMSGSIIGSIPSLSRILSFSPREIGSAEVLTDYSFDELSTENKIGLGTNIVADIYLSFGLIGVVFFMYWLGKFVKIAEQNAKMHNLLWTIVLAALLSDAIYLARTSFTHPARPILWGIAIYYIVMSRISAKRQSKSLSKRLVET